MREYKSREFCKAVGCEVQLELNNLDKDSPEYNKLKETCEKACRKTAWEFHDWLMKEGFSIVKGG